MRAPLLPLTLAYIAGLLGAALRPLPPLWLLVGTGILCVLAGLAVWRHRSRLATSLVLLLAVLLGQLFAQRAALPPPETHLVHHLPPGPAIVEGEVMDRPEQREGRLRLLVAAERLSLEGTLVPTEGLIQTTIYGEAPPVREGDRLQVILRLHPPGGFQNPGAFDYRAFLARNGIHVAGSGRGADLLVVGRTSHGIGDWPRLIREWAEARIQAHLPPRSAALLDGLLLGERRHLPEEIDEAFRNAGVYHLLAISGFNVGLIAGALFLGLKILKFPDRAVALLTLLALITFAAVVGGQPSVLRATLMGCLYFVGRLLEREVSLWNSLAAAALILLLWRPMDLWDAGLQLTFAATAALLAFTEPFTSALTRVRLPRWLAAALAVSLAAQLGVTPLMVFHFNQLSLIGVLANLFVVPLAGLATTLGLVATLSALVSDALAHWFFQSTWLSLLGLRFLTFLFAGLPFALVHVPTPSLAAFSLSYLLLGVLPHWPRGRAWRWGIGLGAILVAALALGPWLIPADGRLRLTMLDVGQGEALLLELPGGERVLVDAGRGGDGGFDVGERVIAPFLWQRGITRLDAAVMTHGDPDHAGGLGAIFRRFHVGELWRTPFAEGGPSLPAGARQRSLSRGDQVRLGPILLTVLHPPAAPLAGSPRGPASDENNNSLVLRITWGRLAILLTADLEMEAEAELLRAGLPLGAAILKVGHHGSQFSSTPEFLAAVRPRVALVSVGRGNPHRHPAPAVVAALEAGRTTVYRTDQDGAVEIGSDGETVWVRARGRPEPVVFRLDLDIEHAQVENLSLHDLLWARGARRREEENEHAERDRSPHVETGPVGAERP